MSLVEIIDYLRLWPTTATDLSGLHDKLLSIETRNLHVLGFPQEVNVKYLMDGGLPTVDNLYEKICTTIYADVTHTVDLY
ncbi:hypothetical protein NPIL_354401 [Nephila pilipes]|uniref:Uncharacterized protein n=1 Tax=Nephila pilipes TaxID=299642 RepID=A0A8X6TK38_NEPPI|nr:hypothetical protein NPIL_354401 [Nephila pilipes]